MHRLSSVQRTHGQWLFQSSSERMDFQPRSGKSLGFPVRGEDNHHVFMMLKCHKKQKPGPKTHLSGFPSNDLQQSQRRQK